MSFALLAPLIGAGISGMFGAAANRKQTKQQNLTNLMQMQAADRNNAFDRDATQRQFNKSLRTSKNQFAAQQKMANQQFNTQLVEAEKDRALQKEFAQNGVQWRVNDAKAAGLHPLAALGMQGASSSPITVSGSIPGGGVPSGGSFSSTTPQLQAPDVSSHMASFGQDISRAISATATEWQRQKEVKDASEQLALENQALQNKILASSVAKTRGASIGPAMPSNRTVRLISGQGNSPSNNLVNTQPGTRTKTARGRDYQEPFDFPDTGFSRTKTGYAPTMSEIVKERTEDDVFSEIPWHIRNRLLPQSLGGAPPPGHVKLKTGQYWEWSNVAQEWRIKNSNTGRKSNIKVWFPNSP